MSNQEPEVLHDIYSSKTFVKIKQCLEIDKMCFSFVNSQEGKTKEHIDCYMSPEEFGLFAYDIKNNFLIKKIIEEKQKGDKYPKAIWTSPMGGTKITGSAISRYFEIAPSSIPNYFCVFTAKAFPAVENDLGAFIPVKDAEALSILRVPCTLTEFRLIWYKWSWLESDYMRKKYNLECMKSNYTYSNNLLPAPTSQPISCSNNENFVEAKSLTQVVGYGNYGFKCLKAITKNNKEMILVIPPDKVNLLNEECNRLKPGVLFRVIVEQYKEKYIVQNLQL